MSNHPMPRRGWKHAARGAMIGTTVAGGLLLTGSTPSIAKSLLSGAVARASQAGGSGYWLVEANERGVQLRGRR